MQQSSIGKGIRRLCKGYRFRVWAPHAREVYVVGSFNHFSKTRNPFKPEPEGIWSGTVSNAKPGDTIPLIPYSFIILSGDK